jgi:hypothetical protein
VSRPHGKKRRAFNDFIEFNYALLKKKRIHRNMIAQVEIDPAKHQKYFVQPEGMAVSEM